MVSLAPTPGTHHLARGYEFGGCFDAIGSLEDLHDTMRLLYALAWTAVVRSVARYAQFWAFPSSRPSHGVVAQLCLPRIHIVNPYG